MAAPSKLRHWLPRLMLLAVAASLLTPLPRYLRGLTPEEYLVWLSQVVWVAGLALAVGLAALAGLWWRRRGTPPAGVGGGVREKVHNGNGD